MLAVQYKLNLQAESTTLPPTFILDSPAYKVKSLVSARSSTLDIPVPSTATDASNLRDITRY